MVARAWRQPPGSGGTLREETAAQRVSSGFYQHLRRKCGVSCVAPTFGDTDSPTPLANWAHHFQLRSCPGEEYREGLWKSRRITGGEASMSSC